MGELARQEQSGTLEVQWLDNVEEKRKKTRKPLIIKRFSRVTNQAAHQKRLVCWPCCCGSICERNYTPATERKYNFTIATINFFNFWDLPFDESYIAVSPATDSAAVTQ